MDNINRVPTPSDPLLVLEEALLARGHYLGVAESCTGGLLASLITDRAGASRWFRGGVVAYNAELKEDLLGVPRGLIVERGIVSREVALAMAEGALRRLRLDLAGAVTGVAGPGADADGNPAGMAWIAVATRTGATVARLISVEGDRLTIKRALAEALLALLAEHATRA